MTPPRRVRTGQRRDGLVRTIRSNEVRYPGLDHPALEQQAYEEWRTGGRTLRPARDTGLAVEGRLARERRRRERQRKRRTVASAVAVAGVMLLAFAWRQSSDTRAAQSPFAAPAPVAAHESTASDPNVSQMRALNPASRPTPIIASYRTLTVRLPVHLDDLTEVGFHQASYGYALHMRIPMPFADSSEAKKAKSTHRDISKQATGPSAVLTGYALKMWRNRPGKPDSACDVGAKAGSDVLAPVSGTVVKVKRYFLYGEHEDYEIHIRPTGHPTIDCVMIHVTGVQVKPGDIVTAGVSRVGAVRKLSDRVHHQLGDYTRGGGDHTHVQLNDATDPDYKGLEGAISVQGS